MLCHWMFYK